jgi:signal transduction histidine kinase
MANILLVDEDAGERNFLATLLGRQGHRLHEASHCAEALVIARATLPDLIIADVLTPEMDGYEFARQLRADVQVAHARLIFYTAGYHRAGARASAETWGVACVLAKPGTPEVILKTVALVLLEPATRPERVLPRQVGESAEQFQRLVVRLRSAQEEERTRVARYLHDELGQMLTALRMNCGWMKARFPAGQTDLSEKMQSCMKLTDEMMVAVQRLATDLRPGILDLGIGAAIDWQVREFQTRSDIACTVEVPGDEDPMDPDRATEMYRIFQEALNNVARHSGATRVNVALKREDSALVLEVRDNGRGIMREELSGSGALGLLGMRERAASIGGTVSIEGAPKSGTTVRIAVPLSAAP